MDINKKVYLTNLTLCLCFTNTITVYQTFMLRIHMNYEEFHPFPREKRISKVSISEEELQGIEILVFEYKSSQGRNNIIQDLPRGQYSEEDLTEIKSRLSEEDFPRKRSLRSRLSEEAFPRKKSIISV